MSCFHPRNAWLSRGVNPSGKRSVVFDPTRAQPGSYLHLPCGRCSGCLADRAAMWSIRCFHESTCHKQNSFLTITYRDECCPEAISKPHMQSFCRGLRDAGLRFRYFLCGEYGSVTRRPHYHALVFGHDFLGGSYQISDQLYGSPLLDKVWSKGFVSVGEFSMGAACYVAGYVSKKVGDPDCFQLMSRRPGIGHDWLDRFGDDLVRTGTVTIEGRELPVPSRYIAWHEKDFEQLRLDRRQRFSSMSLDQQQFRYDRLSNKERNQRSRSSLKRGSL